MHSHQPAVVLASSIVLLVACATPQRYRPAPILPVQTAASLEARSLADPELRLFIEENLGHKVDLWPLRRWDLRALTLAAFYFSPALDSARAGVAAADAAVVTAGARPNPIINITPGVPSPYLLGLDFALPVETARKRGYRVEEAKSFSDAARLELADTAWKVRSSARRALLDYFLAARNLDLLRAEEQTRREQVDLLQRRLTVGQIPRPEVDISRVELSRTLLATRIAEGRLPETRAAVAAAVGIPATALENVELTWAEIDRTPSPDSLTSHIIQRQAVLNRLDVRRALAEYAATDAQLRLEIARQHPDFQIGPGYTFEERNSFFTVGFSTTLPIFNRNQGPIAEAEAKRKQAAANFLATQARVIAESEAALTRYRAALREVAEVDESLTRLQAVREGMARRAVHVGESDRLVLAGVLLERLVMAAGRLDAFGRAQSALGDLEDAVQRPLGAGEFGPLSNMASTREPRNGVRR